MTNPSTPSDLTRRDVLALGGQLALAASLPLCILVFVGSAIVVVRGVREAVALWHRRARSGDWVFPLMVVALFVVVPNLVNGGETNRMRYSIEPVLLLALAGGFLQLLRRYGKRLARLRRCAQRRRHRSRAGIKSRLVANGRHR